MIKFKNLVFVVSCLFADTYCVMTIPQYDRSVGMPIWEANQLNDLAVQYDGAGSMVGIGLIVGVPGYFSSPRSDQLVYRFIACSRNGVVEAPNGVDANPMSQILLLHAQNPIGREIMCGYDV